MNAVVILETLRRQFTSVFFVAFLLVISTIAVFVGSAGTATHTWLELAYVIGMILGAQLIGPEFSSGTLQLILAKPINRTTYLLSRYAGVICAAAILFGVPLLIDIVCRLLWTTGKIEWSEMLIEVGQTFAVVMLACALLALFGTFLRAYFNVGLYFGLQAILAIIIGALSLITGMHSTRFPRLRDFLRAHPGVMSAVRGAMHNLYPDPPSGFSREWVVLVLTNAVFALFIAAWIFRKREVPYGAD